MAQTWPEWKLAKVKLAKVEWKSDKVNLKPLQLLEGFVYVTCDDPIYKLWPADNMTDRCSGGTNLSSSCALTHSSTAYPSTICRASYSCCIDRHRCGSWCFWAFAVMTCGTLPRHSAWSFHPSSSRRSSSHARARLNSEADMIILSDCKSAQLMWQIFRCTAALFDASRFPATLVRTIANVHCGTLSQF